MYDIDEIYDMAFSDGYEEAQLDFADAAAAPAGPSKWQKVKNHLRANGRIYQDAGGLVLGATAGALIAKKAAKRKALAAGLRPGTPEYKSFIRKQMIKGGAIGGVAGAGVAELGRASYRRYKAPEGTKGFKAHMKHAFGGGRSSW